MRILRNQLDQRTLKLAFLAAVLIELCVAQCPAQVTKGDFKFRNIADNTLGLSDLSNFPAINNRGEVAFVAVNNGTQGVFRVTRSRMTTIAEADKVISAFGDDVAINTAGTVAYDANVSTVKNDRAIFTGNGKWTKTIADANQLRVLGRFLGFPSINAAGTVAFLGTRSNFSQIIATGDGGQVMTVADTNAGNFLAFSNVGMNSSGEIAFYGTRDDGSAGVFIANPVDSAPGTILDLADPQNPIFLDPFALFGDPVINEAGVVADVGFFANTNLEIFTADRRGSVARTDPNSSFFTTSEHPSLNNHGAVAFYATENTGGQGIFVELSGGASPVAVVEAGDPLFGSTVTRLDLGRFALNDRNQMAFRYDLSDGRSGIAIAYLHNENEHERDDTE